MTEEQRLEVVFLHRNGTSVRNIARQMLISMNTVSSIVKKHRITGSIKDLTGRGTKKSTAERQDRHLTRNSLNG